MSGQGKQNGATFRLIVRYSSVTGGLEDYVSGIERLQCEPANYIPRAPDDQWRELQSLGGNGLSFYPTVVEDDLLEELIQAGYHIYYGSHWVPLHFRARYGDEDGDGKLLDHLRQVNRRHPGMLSWGCSAESGINQPDVRWTVGFPEQGTFTTKADAYERTKAHYLDQCMANTGVRHFFYSQKSWREPSELREMMFNSWREAGCPRVDGLQPWGLGEVMEHARETGADMSDYDLIVGDGVHTHTFHYMSSFGATGIHSEFNAGCPPCQPSVAFLRGASRMTGARSVLHWSAWGGSEGAAQSYDQDGKHKTGYSPSLQLRQWVFGWLSGVERMTAFEESSRQAWYHDSDGNRRLTKSAENLSKFSHLAVKQGLPGIPPGESAKPYVPFALMFERHHGYSPGHTDIWWSAVEWGKDEDNIQAFFDVAWPSHGWFLGSHKRGRWEDAVKVWRNTQDYYRLRAEGLEAEDFEKGQMSQTRWGDTFDAITEDASPEVLSQYKVIVLLGGIKLGAELRLKLREYVEAGGVVVVNAPQINRAAERWLGVRLGHIPPASRNGGLPFDIDLTDAEKLNIVSPEPITTPEALAHPAPLTNPTFVTRVKRGRGEVYLTTLDYSEPSSMNLYAPFFFDGLFAKHMPMKLDGPDMNQIGWMLNPLPNGWLLTVMNHGWDCYKCSDPDAWRAGNLSKPWNGSAIFPESEFSGTPTARDLWTGQPLSVSKADGGWSVELDIQPYQFVMCALTSA